MDFDLTDRQRELQERVRVFCERECPPAFEQRLDETGEFPAELYRRMAEAGFFGIPFPEEFGGYGGDIMDVVLAAEQFAAKSNTATLRRATCNDT